MKKCPNCGKNNDNKSQYCIGCGSRIYADKTFRSKHYIEFALIGLGIISGIFCGFLPFVLGGIITAIVVRYSPKIAGIISFIIAYSSLAGLGDFIIPSFFFFLAAIACYLGDYLNRYF